MSFHSEDAEMMDIEEPRNMKDLKLSKYGLGIKLKSFTAMLGWTGMILSTMLGLASLIMLFYPIEFQLHCTSHHRLICGFVMGYAVFLLLLSALWFTLSYFLRKNNRLNDLVIVANILKIFCYLQGGLTIFSWISIMVTVLTVMDWQVWFYSLPYVLLALVIPSVMASIVMILGVAKTRLRLVNGYIIYSLVMVVIYVLMDFVYYIALAVTKGSVLAILLVLLESFGFVLFSVFWNGYIITLHSIMEININKFRVFKNNNTSTIQLIEED